MSGIEQGNKSFRSQIAKISSKDMSNQKLQPFEAEALIKDLLVEKRTKENQELARGNKGRGHSVIKDMKFYRKQKERVREEIIEVIASKNISIIGYEDIKKRDEFVEYLTNEIAGHSILEDAIEDPAISDIFINNWKDIFVEKNGVDERYHKSFKSEEHFNEFLHRYLADAGHEMDSGEKKIVNFEVYGNRGCAMDSSVLGRGNGSSLTLRKHPEDNLTLMDVMESGVMDIEIADFLGTVILGERNTVCAGITGSGKTTTMRSLVDHYITKANKRVYVVEDTEELFLRNPNTLPTVTFTDGVKESLNVDQTDLILTGLRQKPKYIVVGEVRGPEIAAAVEAAETGHSTMFTVHGGNSWNVINRIVTKYITAMPSLGKDVVERIIGNAIDYIYVQTNVPGTGRRITAIDEISYDNENNRIDIKPIVVFNNREDKWEWKGNMSEEKAYHMNLRGVPYERLDKWINKV